MSGLISVVIKFVSYAVNLVKSDKFNESVSNNNEFVSRRRGVRGCWIIESK